LECSDAKLHAGAVNGGTSGLFPQLVFRPVPNSAAPKPRWNACTWAVRPPPRAGKYTANAAATRPAPRAALAGNGLLGWPRHRLSRTVIFTLIQ
jgi:hypothetical protein